MKLLFEDLNILESTKEAIRTLELTELTPIQELAIPVMLEGKDFIGRSILEAQKANGVDRKLIGFELKDKGVPRQGYTICDEAGKEIGIVTSGTMSPTRKVGIGMGYVDKAAAQIGTNITIQVRNRFLKAEIVKPPFRK